MLYFLFYLDMFAFISLLLSYFYCKYLTKDINIIKRNLIYLTEYIFCISVVYLQLLIPSTDDKSCSGNLLIIVYNILKSKNTYGRFSRNFAVIIHTRLFLQIIYKCNKYNFFLFLRIT